MKLPIPLDYAPMDARTAREIPQGPIGNTSRSGTGFAAWRFEMAARSSLCRKPGRS
jgi:hypothetical protein